MDVLSDTKKIPNITLRSVTRGNQSKMLRKPYSVKEEAAIIEFLLTKGGCNIIKGKRIWKEMEDADICPGRSGLALREHFLKHTFNRLASFQVTEEQLRDGDKNQEHSETCSLYSCVGGEYRGMRGFHGLELSITHWRRIELLWSLLSITATRRLSVVTLSAN